MTIMDQCVSMLYRDTKHETTVFSFRSIVLDSLRNREIPATKTRGKAKTQNDKYTKKENETYCCNDAGNEANHRYVA